LWPLSDHRFAWDLVSVIDPLLSGLLLLLIVASLIWRKKLFLLMSVAWISLYLSIAAIQHQRALDWATALAAERSHRFNQLHAKPSFGNIVVWKTLYEFDEVFYVDAVRPGLLAISGWKGASVAKLNIERDLPWLDTESQQAADVERFRHFSAGFIALDPNNPKRIGDIRYSQLPQAIDPLWGIEVSPAAGPAHHAVYVTDRSGSRDDMTRLLNMIFSIP
jgi:inner membrane protein